MGTLLQRFTSWLRQSSSVHAREIKVLTLPDLVALIDRFLADALRYPLEWDDFISWQNEVPVIETFRLRLVATERLCFSRESSERTQGVDIIVQERNKAASIVGLQPITHEAAEQFV